MESENKPAQASFGKLFIAFFMVMLLALALISMQTSEKLKTENERAIEESMASELDELVADSTIHEYIKDTLAPIIKIARKQGPESQELQGAISEAYFKRAVSLKGFFYRENELVQSINANEKDLKVFTELFKQLAVERAEPNYNQVNRAAHAGLIELFDTGARLELLKLHKGYYTNFSKNDGTQQYYFNSYENGIGVFFYTTKVPNFIQSFNILIKNRDSSKFGAISSDNKTIIAPKGFSEDQTLLAYLKTTKSNKPFVISNDNYWYFQTNRFGNKICYVEPAENNSKIAYKWAELSFEIATYLFIIAFFIYLTSLFNTNPGKWSIDFLDNLSIRYRIIGIFTMASVFPVLMTAIIGASLLADQQTVIEKNILSESLAAIYNIESQGDILLEKTEKMAGEIREGVKEAYLANRPITREIFDKYLTKYSIPASLSRLDIRDADMNTILTLDDRQIHGVANMLDIICRIVLKLHNPERVNQSLSISPGELVSESVVSTDELGFATIMRERGKQWLFRIGAFPTTWYWDIYPELATGPAFICVTTQVIITYEQQIQDYMYSQPISSHSIQIAVHESGAHYEDSLITPHKNLPEKEILDIAITSFDTNKVLFRRVYIDNKPYWITAKHGKAMNSHVHMHLISQKERLAALEPFKWQLTLIGTFALLISIFGAWFITNLIILPVGDLSKGILAIRHRNKEFNIPVRRNDEFGKLATAFNRVIGDLEELEYGKIVQESLLPSAPLEVDGYDLAYFHVSATDLAGDYHDNALLDDGRLAIVMGDVSGHGISASLAMAMAKATFNYAKSLKVTFPDELMDMLNTMFNRELKPRNKLMTMVSVILDPKTSEIVFENSGQCFPAYYSSATNSCEELKMPSLPLGGMKKRKKKPLIKTMESGDGFILYTDGIIECASSQGEMFGYDRFFQTFNELMNQGLSSQEILKEMFKKLEDFREPGPFPDDITMIILRKK